MSHPCQFNVYRRTRGERKKTMMASFALLTDAVNYAFSCSYGRYQDKPRVTMIVLDEARKVFRKFCQGNIE